MKRIKHFFGSRTIGFYFMIGAIIFEILAFVLNGIFSSEEEMNLVLIISGALASCIGFISCLLEYKKLRVFFVLFSLITMVVYLYQQIRDFMNKMNTSISLFVLLSIFFFLSVSLGIVSIFLTKRKEDKVTIVICDK